MIDHRTRSVDGDTSSRSARNLGSARSAAHQRGLFLTQRLAQAGLRTVTVRCPPS